MNIDRRAASRCDSAPHQHGNDRLIRLVPGIAAAEPDRTLAHAGTSSSVKHLLERAQQLGLAGTPNSSPPPPLPPPQRFTEG